MAETGQNKPTSMRTPLSRVEGLGAAHHGVEHWWSHRISAIANVPLVIAFVIIIANLAGRPWPDAVRIVSNPLVAVLLGLLVISVTFHMRLGIQTVIEDYVHEKLPKLACNVGNTFFAILIAASCLFSILKISFGRVPLPL